MTNDLRTTGILTDSPARRNHVPWLIIGICYVVCPVLLLYIRHLLARENRKRDAEPVDDKYDDVYIEVVLPDGTRTERRVDKVSAPLSSSGGYGFLRCAVLMRARLRRNTWT